jgi:hypothetical protein
LAVAWALEYSRFFTLGCDDLVIVTDHKPLTKILGDRTFDEIHNTRLFRLKQRTLPWRFSIVHSPGETNLAADVISRYPTTHDPDAQRFAEEEEAEVSSIKFSMQANLFLGKMWCFIPSRTLICVPFWCTFMMVSQPTALLVK